MDETRRGIFGGNDPFAIARHWLDEAGHVEPNDPNAMALATVDPAGLPNVRMVLLKEIEPDGFVFYTNYGSAKAGEIDRSQLVAKRLAEELRNVQQVLESEESRMYSSSVLVVYEGDPSAMEHALEEEKKIPDPATQDDEEDDGDDEDEDVGFEISEEALELVDVQLPGGMPQKAINISIDPQSAQMPALGSGEDDEDEEEIPKVHDLRLIDFAHAQWTPGEGPDENVLQGIRNLIKVFEELAE